jgi:nitrate/TMAO reductase-like tetraheme cytochrome c subunit
MPKSNRVFRLVGPGDVGGGAPARGRVGAAALELNCLGLRVLGLAAALSLAGWAAAGAARAAPEDAPGLRDAPDAALIAQAQSGGSDSLLGGGDAAEGSNGGDSLLGGDEGDADAADGDALLSGEDAPADGDGDSLIGGQEERPQDGDSLLSGGGGASDGAGGGLLDGGQQDGDAASDGLLSGQDGDDAGRKAEDGETPSDEKTAFQMHKEAYEDAGERYPSATECATCHPRHYRQWSVSQHAYAQLSPVYMAMQMTMNAKTAGTVGDFCIRCHNPVGMNLGESVYTSNLDRHPTSREGITCVVCHRMKKAYGEVSGRLPLDEGSVVDPVYGPKGNEELQRVLDTPQKYRVVTDPEKPGREIHKEARKFFQMNKSGFCATCHDVTLPNGFRLEEAFAEYHQSPASDKGKSCQDCHMGKEQGVASGYDRGPAAVVGDEPTEPRKLTNHYFAGPDYPIIHPGLFPLNVEAQEFKTMRQWLKFDYEAGWGTEAFEREVSLDREFPDAWYAPADRYDARDILEDQFDKLEWAKQERLEALRNGYGMSAIRVVEAGPDGLVFEIDVRNKTDGHALPTGFDAERLFFLQIKVRDADGRLVFQSGDRDPNGDVRDSHSLYVHAGKAPLDEQLFTLQSRFLVRLARGGEREEVLTLNHNISPQPLVRPETRATTIYGRPRGARKHKRSIPPLGEKTARYVVDGDALTGNGPYTVTARFIGQMVPVNLIAKIKDVGFDYKMSPKEVADRVVEGAMTLYEKTATIRVDGTDPGGQTARAD